MTLPARGTQRLDRPLDVAETGVDESQIERRRLASVDQALQLAECCARLLRASGTGEIVAEHAAADRTSGRQDDGPSAALNCGVEPSLLGVHERQIEVG